MMQHSDIIGGSSAERRIHCTGSMALEQQMPEEESSQHALEGTALHDIMYKALDNPDNALPERGKSYWWSGEEGHVDFSADEMEARFWPAYEAVCELIERHKIEEYDLEVTHAHEKTCGPEVFGTLDFVGWSQDGYVVVADFKFGQGVKVYAQENTQLAFYAVGLWESGVRITDKVVFVIIQPWYDESVDTIDEWETSMIWLEVYRQQERKAYLRIIQGDTSLKAGKWCKFCKAAPICPEQQQSLDVYALTSANGPEGMSAMKLAELLNLGEQAVAMHKKVVDYATKLGERGIEIPGYKVVESLGHRKFADPDLAERVAVQVVGSDAYQPKTLKSPAQLEKACKTRKVSFEPLESLIVRPSKGGRLVPDTDKRPKIAPVHAAPVDRAIVADIIPLPLKKA